MLNLAPSLLISRIITLIVALTVHEFAHAFVADRFGDNTARAAGRLTLNPLKHLDVFGSLMLLLAGFGWAKPVPVNPYLLRRHSASAMMWVSLAGPASNFLLALISGLMLRFNFYPLVNLGSVLPTPVEFLYTFMVINLLLMVFNLIPLAPLDGEKIALFLMPPKWTNAFESIQRFGPLILMLLVFVAPRFGFDIFGWLMNPIFSGWQKIILGVS